MSCMGSLPTSHSKRQQSTRQRECDSESISEPDKGDHYDDTAGFLDNGFLSQN